MKSYINLVKDIKISPIKSDVYPTGKKYYYREIQILTDTRTEFTFILTTNFSVKLAIKDLVVQRE